VNTPLSSSFAQLTSSFGLLELGTFSGVVPAEEGCAVVTGTTLGLGAATGTVEGVSILTGGEVGADVTGATLTGAVTGATATGGAGGKSMNLT
jgi:hypothetical protein